MTDLKSKISTICGIILAACGVVLAMPMQGVIIPAQITSVVTIIAAIAGGIIGILTGKNPDLSTKTDAQIQKQLNEKEVSK